MNNLDMQRVNEIRRNKNISQIHRLLPIIVIIGGLASLEVFEWVLGACRRHYQND